MPDRAGHPFVGDVAPTLDDHIAMVEQYGRCLDCEAGEPHMCVELMGER